MLLLYWHLANLITPLHPTDKLSLNLNRRTHGRILGLR